MVTRPTSGAEELRMRMGQVEARSTILKGTETVELLTESVTGIVVIITPMLVVTGTTIEASHVMAMLCDNMDVQSILVEMGVFERTITHATGKRSQLLRHLWKKKSTALIDAGVHLLFPKKLPNPLHHLRPFAMHPLPPSPLRPNCRNLRLPLGRKTFPLPPNLSQWEANG